MNLEDEDEPLEDLDNEFSQQNEDGASSDDVDEEEYLDKINSDPNRELS